MAQSVQIKRGTTSAWASSPATETRLFPGQLGIEYVGSGYARMKVGLDNAEQSPTTWAASKYMVPDIRVYTDTAIIGNSSFNATLPNINSTAVLPITANSGSLGTEPKKWASAYISNVNSNMLMPNGADTSIGSEVVEWGRLYATNVYSKDLTNSGAITSGSLKTNTLYPVSSSSTLGQPSNYWGIGYITTLNSTTISNSGSITGGTLYNKSGSTSYRVPVVFRGTGAPSGGSDGDLYIQYIN